jgi:hypothetical protein
MLVEYKIKFEKDGVTVTQRFEPNASNRREAPNVSGKPKVFLAVGDTVGDPPILEQPEIVGEPPILEQPEIVGGGPGSGRVIAFGPVIFCGSDGTGVVLPAKDVPGKDKDKDAEKAKPAPPPARAPATKSK